MGADGRMITGTLRGSARPFVNCSLSLPRLGMFVDDVMFLVDNGRMQPTCIRPTAGI